MKKKVFYSPGKSPNIAKDIRLDSINNHISKKAKTSKTIYRQENHVLLGEGCAKSSAWKQKQTGAALFSFLMTMLIAIIITTSFVGAEELITLEKSSYDLEEIVTIKLEQEINPSWTLSISSETSVFKYSGELKGSLEFRPREEGTYLVLLYDEQADKEISSSQFTVSKNAKITNDKLLWLEKSNYSVNETVLIQLELSWLTEEEISNENKDFELRITSDEESLRYLGALESPIKFIPSKGGDYKVQLERNFIPLANTFFTVTITDNATKKEGEENNNSKIEAAIAEDPVGGTSLQENTKLSQLEEKDIISETVAFFSSQIPSGKTMIEETLKIPYSAGQLPPETILPNDKRIYPGIMSRNYQSSAEKKTDAPSEILKMKLSGEKQELSSKYEEEKNDKILAFTNHDQDNNNNERAITLTGQIEGKIRAEIMREETLIRAGSPQQLKSYDDTRKILLDKKMVNSLREQRILITIKDSFGEKADLPLYYDKNASKIILPNNEEDNPAIRPGTYLVTITDENTGDVIESWFQYGLISINTNKPMYHPGEQALITMVVLDRNGYLVGGAEITLQIITEGEEKKELSTTAGSIISSAKGIYQAEFSPDHAGTYTLNATGIVRGVPRNIMTDILAADEYPYDIIREAQHTIDPNKELFTNRFSISPEMELPTIIKFREYLPAIFIINSTNADESYLYEDRIMLEWNSLSLDSQENMPYYSAQTPLLTPYLYQLGKAEIEYDYMGAQVFYEQRVWNLAIDPAAITCSESPCDTTTLIDGRDTITGGPEPNQPNTIDGCADGTDGTYHTDESLDRIIITNLDRSGSFRAGDTVQVNTTIWCYSTYTSDRLNVVYTNNSESPSWKVLNSVICPGAGAQTISYEFVLDNTTGNHTIRGTFMYNGAAGTTCGTGSYDDNDDVTIIVLEKDSIPPMISETAANESTIAINGSVRITTTATDDSDIITVNATIRVPNGTETTRSMSLFHELTNESAQDNENSNSTTYGQNGRALTQTYTFDGVTTSSTNASAWFNDADQFLYGGSIANRNTHVAFTDTQYTNIASSDNNYATSVDPGNADEIVADFMFMITQNISRITNISFTTESRVGIAGTSTRYLYLLRAGAAYQTDGNWLLLGSCSGASNTDITCTQNLNSDFSTYISSIDGRIDWSGFLSVSTETNYYDYAAMTVYYTGDPDTEADGSWKEYNDTSQNNWKNISQIIIKVNITSYNSSGSDAAGNRKPDLQAELYNGTGWINIGNFSANSTGIFTVSTSNQALTESWEKAANRDLRIRGINLDYTDATHYDKITYSDIWTAAEYQKPRYELIWNETAKAGRYDVASIYASDSEGNSNQTNYTDISFWVLNYGKPEITIISIENDTTETYSFTSETPTINASINTNATCYLSEQDESYSQMVANGRISCGQYEINIPKGCIYTTSLSAGSHTLYMACNNTLSGAENNETDNKQMAIEVLCDSHSDCPSSQYCDYTQHCHQDEEPGYPCDTQAYSPLEWNPVCGNGTNRFCVNDSSYSYTGWYCTASATDCIFNNQGKSYEISYNLCNSSGNDYKSCSMNNEWSSWFDCGEQYDPYNQSATAHPGEYCAYFASAQTCINGTGGGCDGIATDCNPYTYNQTTNICGSSLADCDFGCGAGCDSSNSTAPNIMNGTCYYDKSCSNACAWSQNNEFAPSFCINDNDGGTCAYSNRTNPSAEETCYWNATCSNIIGALLANSSTLRADYCDYCTISGNTTGQYAPRPNSTCLGDCEDSGTIYYDTEGTPADRSDDCSGEGISSLMSDTLSIGDIWDGTSPAYCDDTECDNDCGTMVGACNIGICECTDTDNPELTIIWPDDNTWTNNTAVIFRYNITDISSEIKNCSLIINGSTYQVNTSINKSLTEQTFMQELANGTWNWSIICYDNSTLHHSNQSEARIVGVDTVIPSISNPSASGTSYNINQQVCLNVSASDTISGISRVYARIQLPDLSYEEVDLYDSSTTNCDSTNGNGIYSTEYTLIFDGTYNWEYAYATDLASNTNNTIASTSWNVTAGGNISVNMTAPASNITINESEANNHFNQNCSVTCQNNGTNCKNVILFPQYYVNGGWEKMNFSTALSPDALNYSCGNLSSQGSASWWNSSWQYRKKISVINKNNTNNLPTNYSLRISVNTIGSTILDNGNDARIAYWNGTNNTEIDRINTTAFNSSNTEIWFKIQKDVSPGATDTNYYIYYGNPSAGAAPQNKTKVYDFWDDLSGGLNQWTIDSENTDAVSVSSSDGNPAPSLRHDPDSTQTKNAYYDTRLQTTDYRFQNGIIEYDIYLSGTARSIHQFGFRVPNLNFTNGYCWRLQSSSNDGGWLEFTGRASWATFGTAYPATTTETWHHVILNISGANYNATIDGGSVYSGTDSTKLSADYLVSHVHATGTDYYVLIDNIQARKTMSPAPSTSLQEEESPPVNNASCSHTFNITAQPDSGNSILGIRCRADSSNSATTFSESINVTINDHPTAMINYPENGTWVTGTININASMSYDSDGNIVNYLYEYDNNTGFTSPSTICSTTESNCTWNTLAQNQCENNSISCYLRVTVLDDKGLTNSTYLLLGFDTQGPATALLTPTDYDNITTSPELVMATSTDGESGMGVVFFEYRQNSTDSWKPICNRSAEPYDCNWNVSELPDGNTYEVRAYATDLLNNTGNYDFSSNITIDRTGPEVNLESPENNMFTQNTNIILWYNATDATTSIANCTLILNGSTNDIHYEVEEGTPYSFDLDLEEGKYYWQVECDDTLSNKGQSETRNFTIDTTGPTTILESPANLANITINSYQTNASIIDAGIGAISTATFLYRKGSGEWMEICQDATGPEYGCLWNLTGLEDGEDYEVRAYANDTLGNTGNNDTHTNIRVDRYPPQITIIGPENQSTDDDGNIIFTYTTTDLGSGISNCELIWEGAVNATEPGPLIEGEEYQFIKYDVTDGNYTWTINCTDNLGHEGTGGLMNLTVEIKYEMKVNVTTDKQKYEIGNEEGEPANITTKITTPSGGELYGTEVKTDIIMVHNTTEQAGPWWNTSWKQRKPIYITSNHAQNRTNLTIIINITGLAGNITSCSNEIRVACINGYETPVNIISGDDSTYCEIAFKANVSGNATNENKYYAYYNNSDASASSYPSMTNFTYQLFFENFDVGGWTTTTGVSPSTACAGGYGSFNNCLAFTSDYDYAATTSGTEISGTYKFVMDQAYPWAANRSIWYSFNALTACGGDACDDIRVTGYAATSSVDNTAEFCRVWARNSTGTAYSTIYECVGPDPACEFSDTDSAPTSTAQYDFFNQTLKGNLGLGLSDYTAVHIGGNVPAANDNCFYEDINITGTRKQAPNITSTGTGSPQEWIANTTGTTNINGLVSYTLKTANMTPTNYSAASLGEKELYTEAYNYTIFELGKDRTPPNISLNRPPPGSEVNSSVTFSYYVNDTLSSVINCSLIIDNAIQETDPTIQEGIIQYFYPRIPQGGWHNWSINCTDYYGNTGASESWTLFVKPPDLFVSSENIEFSNNNPKQGDNITINATIFNIGGSDATNVIIQLYLEDPEIGGTQLGENTTINLTDINGDESNKTISITWIVPGPGPFKIYAVADPPTSTNGSILEINETNNKAYNTINIPAYHYFYGQVKNNIYLASSDNNSMYHFLNLTNLTGNILAADQDSTISFSELQAIGRSTTNTITPNDFNETDAALNMTHFEDSIRAVFTNNTDIPNSLMNLVIFNRQINNIPMTPSTNNTNFMTGLLWDAGDGGTQYNGSQDLVLITPINYTRTGAFGEYDYEIKVPVKIEGYRPGADNVALYWEVT